MFLSSSGEIYKSDNATNNRSQTGVWDAKVTVNEEVRYLRKFWFVWQLQSKITVSNPHFLNSLSYIVLHALYQGSSLLPTEYGTGIVSCSGFQTIDAVPMTISTLLLGSLFLGKPELVHVDNQAILWSRKH